MSLRLTWVNMGNAQIRFASGREWIIISTQRDDWSPIGSMICRSVAEQADYFFSYVEDIVLENVWLALLMIKGWNGGVIVSEFAIIVPLTLSTPGRVENEINYLSMILTPKIPSLLMTERVRGMCRGGLPPLSSCEHEHLSVMAGRIFLPL